MIEPVIVGLFLWFAGTGLGYFVASAVDWLYRRLRRTAAAPTSPVDLTRSGGAAEWQMWASTYPLIPRPHEQLYCSTVGGDDCWVCVRCAAKSEQPFKPADRCRG